MLEIVMPANALAPLPTSLQCKGSPSVSLDMDGGATLALPDYLNDPECQALIRELMAALMEGGTEI